MEITQLKWSILISPAKKISSKVCYKNIQKNVIFRKCYIVTEKQISDLASKIFL